MLSWIINTRAPIVGTTEALYLRDQHASSKINAMMILITQRLKRFAILTEEIECRRIFNLPLSGLDGGHLSRFAMILSPEIERKSQQNLSILNGGNAPNSVGRGSHFIKPTQWLDIVRAKIDNYGVISFFIDLFLKHDRKPFMSLFGMGICLIKQDPQFVFLCKCFHNGHSQSGSGYPSS